MGDGNNRSSSNNEKPEWLQQYNLIGKIGEGTYGLVFLAKTKSPANRGKSIAIKKFKQSKDGDGVSPTAIREIMLLREITHENVVKLVNVHINHTDMSLYLAFDYAEHDLYEIIRHHRDKGNNLINQYTVKSLLWQLLNGLNYLHRAEAKSTSNPFQLDQLDKIFKVLGHPTLEKWPTLASLPHWQNDVHRIQEHKYENTGLHSVVPLSPKGAPFDLLSKMLEYDPQKRITAAQALEHDYFRSEPLPGRNALVPSQPGEKVINYPTRPVDTNTDFEGTTSLQPPQPVSSGNTVSGGIPGAHGVNNRSAPRPMPVGLQRMQAQGMAAYNLASQAGMGGGMNPGNIPMPRGVAQPHQQHQLRRKDPPGTGTGYPPQQKSRR
ncbi:hypothetical protein D5086_007115 [Populus alba]|uniref:Uncharacterized protein n=1 Tax=Populus alba TaxID=43335 RepID=A0ACC4CNL5_POPAL